MIDLTKIVSDTESFKDNPGTYSHNGTGHATIWNQTESLESFIKNRVEMPQGLVSDLVFPGGTTVVAAPSTTGKSIVLYILERALASGAIFRGEKLQTARILHIDYDNPKAITQERMASIFQDYDVDMNIISRDMEPPQLLNKTEWSKFPKDRYDLVVIDSFGTAAVGVSEKEGAKLQNALDTLRLIADRGPAVFVLENTDKTGTSYRGRGEKVERVEIFYEVQQFPLYPKDPIRPMSEGSLGAISCPICRV